MNPLLQLKNLCVSIDEQPIIQGLNLSIDPGAFHAIMGPNGSGKSSLALAIMGHPRYAITSGSIIFSGQDITSLAPDKRAKLGIFLSFQQPYELPGVRVFTFLKELYQAMHGKQISVKEFELYVQEAMEMVGMDQSFASRNVNEGFSGGEKKRFEMVQLLIAKPRFAIMDEIDSGLDVDALKAITGCLQQLCKENPTMSILCITHYQRILQHCMPDHVHVMCDGTIVKSGPAVLANEVDYKGYDAFRSQRQTTQ